MHKFGEPGSNDFWSSISYQCLPLFHRRMASVRHYLYVRGNLTCLLDSHPCMATNVWNVQSTRTKLIATQIRQRHSRSCPRHQHADDCSEALDWPRSNFNISRRMQYSHSSGNAHSFAGSQLRMQTNKHVWDTPISRQGTRAPHVSQAVCPIKAHFNSTMYNALNMPHVHKELHTHVVIKLNWMQTQST